MSPLEQWLADATRGLSPESAAQVRAEIQQHYDSACEAGGDAIAALGNPRAANRAYRKVLLTEQEAMMAPVLTRPKRSLPGILLSSGLLAGFLWLLSAKHPAPGFWPVLAAMLCTAPVTWFFPPNTLDRSRVHLYIHGLRNILAAAIFWWYQGWIGALVFGAVCFLLDYFLTYRRFSILRKLASGQTFNPLPEEPQLTHLEAMYLHTLQKGAPHENVSIAVAFLMLAGMTVWQPATFAPLATWIAAGFLAPRTLPIYTEKRSRWFRIAKWTTMAAAAVLPVLYGARIPWAGAVSLAFFFVLFDLRNISLRRKLPASQWPQRLYW